VKVRSNGFILGGGLVVAVALLALVAAPDPLDALRALFVAPFASTFRFGNLVNRAGILVFGGLATIIALRSGRFNLGGEGQAYVGALAAVLTALSIPSIAGSFGIGLALVAAFLAGAALAGLSAVLRLIGNIDELLSSFLISLSAVPMIDALINSPYLRDAESYLMTTRTVAEGFLLRRVLPPSKLSPFALVAFAAAVWLAWFLKRTRWGYELTIFGENREYARFVGIPKIPYTLGPMLASGGLYGLAGALVVLGGDGALIQGATAGVGWDGIAVALMAANLPIYAPLAGLFLAYLYAGSTSSVLAGTLPIETTTLVQALVFLTITARFVRAKGSTT
jgi:ABC-type uncharacterized transport system permease subunit